MGRALILLLAFLGFFSRAHQRPMASYDQYQVTGFFGCRFSAVCTDGEVCIDDGLFGNCQKVDSTIDQRQYDLPRDVLDLLTLQLENLVGQGYAWDNLYTQCVVGNILINFRAGNQPDLTLCEPQNDEATPGLEEITPDTMELLNNLVTEYNVNKVQKRKIPSEDEYIKVHKYLKERKSENPEEEIRQYLASLSMDDLLRIKDYLKRLRDIIVSDEDSLKAGDVDVDVANWPDPTEMSDWLNRDESDEEKESPDWDIQRALSNEPEYPNEISKTPEYLTAFSNAPEYPTAISNAPDNNLNYPEYPQLGDYPQNREDAYPNDSFEKKSYVDDDEENQNISPDDDEENQNISPDDDGENKNISPDDAKLLYDLLGGKELPDDLSDKELHILTEEVSQMLHKIRFEDEVDEKPEMTSRSDKRDFQDDSVEQVDEEIPTGITAEQMSPLTSESANVELEGDMTQKREKGDESEINPMTIVEAADEELEEKEKEADEKEKEKAKEQDEAAKRSDITLQKHVVNLNPAYDHVKSESESEDEDKSVTQTPPDTLQPNVVTDSKYNYVDARYVYVEANRSFESEEEALRLLGNLQYKLHLPPGSFSDARIRDATIVFRVNANSEHINASEVARLAMNNEMGGNLMSNVKIVDAGTRDWEQLKLAVNSDKPRYFVLTFVVCGCVAGVLLAVLAIYLIRRHTQTRQKLSQLSTADPVEASKDYQDLCRQRMQSKASEKPEPLHAGGRVSSVASDGANANSPSSRSSTSSWSEEPVVSNMDITTGHMILSYMEDHMKNKDRLDQEWDELSKYVSEPNNTNNGGNPQNARKNRYTDILPYDHSRVVLNSVSNVLGSDYVNANTITDHDPRNPAYIATQGPLPHTVADFWQMVWEQGSVVIVMLTKMTENGNTMCHRYWPEEGSDLYHIYEVHLVSEHIWCDDYLVRSFYLKNLQTNETRTVTQFHFLTWPDLGIPSSAKALLDFRRKVNKSYKGRSCPIVVHCNDGVGRTGIYCLIDMVLSRMSKGAKEIDIAATLEHIRDQRMSMVKTKEQFEFTLTCVAEEVHAILKALPQ